MPVRRQAASLRRSWGSAKNLPLQDQRRGASPCATGYTHGVIEPQPATGRVTTLELFFDLVFVFTITQLTPVLVTDPTPRGVLQVALMLGVIWWMSAATPG